MLLTHLQIRHMSTGVCAVTVHFLVCFPAVYLPVTGLWSGAGITLLWNNTTAQLTMVFTGGQLEYRRFPRVPQKRDRKSVRQCRSKCFQVGCVYARRYLTFYSAATKNLQAVYVPTIPTLEPGDQCVGRGSQTKVKT